jgi:hypothetical protein
LHQSNELMDDDSALQSYAVTTEKE